MKGTRILATGVGLSLVLGYLTVGTIETGAVGTSADNPGEVRSAVGPSAGPVPSGSGAEAGDGTVRLPGGRVKASCAPGKNGGSTDIGVTGTKIRLASTMVTDGNSASLLSQSPIGMRAVVDKVNAEGGICGRAIDLILRNDSFDQKRGLQFITAWAEDKEEDIFALAVAPSAEGLGAAIQNGVISGNGIPVVGTDGMRSEQYRDPWVWPVATATVSTMRIIANFGYKEKRARSYAIVYDSKYKFGREGADSFKAQVAKLKGKLVTSVALNPDVPSYASEVNAFNIACGEDKCDMVAMLLLPDTAQKWFSRKPVRGKLYNAGAQTLFTDDFAQACASAAGTDCHGFAVWTGYNPPIDRYASIPDVAAYVDDVRRIAPTADVRNQFLEGAYLGMKLMVDALRKVGPDLTREGLRLVLDSMTFKNQITAGLTWKPGVHNANRRARSFSMVISNGNFIGWRDEQTGWVVDPSSPG